MNNPLQSLMQINMGGGTAKEDYDEGQWLDSDPYMLLLSKDGDEIISLYEFTDLVSAHINISDLKIPEDEIKGKKKEILHVKGIVKEYFSEILL